MSENTFRIEYTIFMETLFYNRNFIKLFKILKNMPRYTLFVKNSLCLFRKQLN